MCARLNKRRTVSVEDIRDSDGIAAGALTLGNLVYWFTCEAWLGLCSDHCYGLWNADGSSAPNS